MTDHRVLVGILRLADKNALPYLDRIERVAASLNHSEIASLVLRYTHDAELDAQLLAQVGGRHQVVVASLLANEIVTAADLAYYVRAAAQGSRGAAPSAAVWALLVLVLTVLTFRRKQDAVALLDEVLAVCTALSEL